MKYSLLLQPKQDGRGSYKLNVASDTKYINTCNTDTYGTQNYWKRFITQERKMADHLLLFLINYNCTCNDTEEPHEE